MADLKHVVGGTVVTSDGPVRADIVISGGRIAALMTDAGPRDDAEIIDAAGLVVVPGGVDVHTHFRVPDPRMVEGFDTGSQAALAGGVTTAIEMPQAAPTATTGEVVRQKKGLVEEHARIDIALWGGVIGQSIEDVQAMLDEGVVALKAFMPASSPSFPHINDATMHEIFELIAGSEVPFGLHCENDALLQAGIARLQAAGRTDPLAHAESRPPLVETEAINRAIFFAEVTGGRLYVCHCATADGLELIREARGRGVWVEVETCPQYLLLDLSDLEAQGPWGRCAPAIRARDEVERIWEGVFDGTIDVISSDHAPYTVEEKRPGEQNIWDSPLGCNMVQTMYPSVLDEMVHRRGLSLNQFVDLTATNPARIFGLYPRKGAIQVGSDADLTLYDLERPWTVRGSEMLHRNKWTPFEGKTIGVTAVKTLVRGDVRFDIQSGIVGEAGTGNFLPRGYGESRD
jgi:allantoinase